MKIITVLGARPQFVKAGAVSREISKYDNVQELIVHTGQHYDTNMSDIFFEQMDIPKPDYNLGIHGKTHGLMTGKMLGAIDEIILKEKPDQLMVYGDTNSTLAGALSACKLHVPVVHVEAGLRSFDMQMPEEINRILTDRISSKLFCPTETAVHNLKTEGFDLFENVKIVKTGDVMQDTALYFADKACPPEITNKQFSFENPFALVTLHRAENTDDPYRLKNAFHALQEISTTIPILMPLHPRTKKMLATIGIDIDAFSLKDKYQITYIEPVGYLEMIYLLKKCRIVLTDSGGLQKEAFFFGKPCVTLRDQTEWVELVDGGHNVLAGTEKSDIIRGFKKMIDAEVSDPLNLYGGGQAAKLVVENLVN